MNEVLEPYFDVEVGRCIYCPRERTTWDEPLGNEHVIPLGMGGVWQLLRASCREHEKVTTRFERIVMNQGGLKDLREVMGFPSRRAKKRTGMRDVTFMVGDERRTETVPLDQHPGGWYLPVYAPPTKLTGEEPAEDVRVLDRVGKRREKAVQELQERFGITALVMSVVDPRAWAQMMAKIGYCFAVGCVGLDTFEEVYVLPTILEGKLLGHYVGCLEGAPINTGSQGNLVTMSQAQRELTVYIRLFAQMEFPEYTVVVGRLRDTTYTIRARSLVED
jgi:hypothetical protein